MSFVYHKISTATKQVITSLNDTFESSTGSPKSMTICNRDAGTDACSVDLYFRSEVGTDIIDTTTDVNFPTSYPTSSSFTLTVDGTNATDDIFDEEKVWKSDGTLIGTCSSVTNTTTIVFSGGIEQTLADNDSLYVGARHYVLHNVVIPAGCTLVLEGLELDFDSTTHRLVFLLDSVSAGQIIDIKLTY